MSIEVFLDEDNLQIFTCLPEEFYSVPLSGIIRVVLPEVPQFQSRRISHDHNKNNLTKQNDMTLFQGLDRSLQLCDE